ncbi:MAG: OmpA family protein [Bacteroidia bacterium]|nr:OmpA family protein [Bacteroidia bacterium]
MKTEISHTSQVVNRKRSHPSSVIRDVLSLSKYHPSFSPYALYLFLTFNFLPFLTLSLMCTFNCSAQDISVKIDKDKLHTKGDAGWKEAWSACKEGEALWEQGIGFFIEALNKYLAAYKYNSDCPELNYKIGVCYLESAQKDKSMEYFLKAYEVNKRVAIDILYQIGRGYHLKMDFDKAIEFYNNYKSALSPNEFQKLSHIVQKRIDECNNGKELVKKKERVFIDNLGPAINSPYPDYSPLISTDESMMIFTSRRSGGTGSRIAEDGMAFEDIYYSYNENGKWKKAENIGKPLNTDEHDATIGLAPDGSELFIYKTENAGDLYVSKLKGTEWSKPKSVKGINSKFHETCASFSFSGNTIYYVSDRDKDDYGTKSYGGKDIYYAEKDADGEWGKVKNMGTTINTMYDEEAVFMHPDGKTLYFSSCGHKTMGEYDIFKSTLNDKGEWTTPENIGYPINTTDDDRFFVISGSGKHGYYASVKEGGYGFHDIYMITFLGHEKPLVQSNEDNLIACLINPVKEVVVEKAVEIKTMWLTVLKGTVKDAFNNEPVEATIEIIDNVKNKTVFTSTSNSKTGKFLVSLPSGRNYGIAVKADKYLFHSENFDLAEAKEFKEVEKEIKLKKMDVGVKIILRNIFFDYAKSTLRSESYGELDRLQKLLTDAPDVKIEISGHTDNTGTKQFNKPLSENRAKAVVDYLIKNGIVKERLTFAGYADEQPIADNKTDDGRQQNRRVEFKVTSVTK